MLKYVFHFEGCVVASHNGRHLWRQLRHELADVFEASLPADGDADQIEPVPDQPAQRLGVLVRFLIPKVEKCYLADKTLHAGSDILEAGRRENPQGRGGTAEVRVQSECVLVCNCTGQYSKVL